MKHEATNNPWRDAITNRLLKCDVEKNDLPDDAEAALRMYSMYLIREMMEPRAKHHKEENDEGDGFPSGILILSDPDEIAFIGAGSEVTDRITANMEGPIPVLIIQEKSNPDHRLTIMLNDIEIVHSLFKAVTDIAMTRMFPDNNIGGPPDAMFEAFMKG